MKEEMCVCTILHTLILDIYLHISIHPHICTLYILFQESIHLLTDVNIHGWYLPSVSWHQNECWTPFWRDLINTPQHFLSLLWVSFLNIQEKFISHYPEELKTGFQAGDWISLSSRAHSSPWHWQEFWIVTSEVKAVIASGKRHQVWMENFYSHLYSLMLSLNSFTIIVQI